YRGGRVRAIIDQELYSGLKQLGWRYNSTLFMTLLGVFELLLHRLTGQDDIVVGIPAAARSRRDADRFVGYSIKLLPLRSRVETAPGFASYLRSVRGVLLDAYEHQEFSLRSLIKKLNVPRDPSRSTLVSVMFNLDSFENLSSFGLKADLMPAPAAAA